MTKKKKKNGTILDDEFPIHALSNFMLLYLRDKKAYFSVWWLSH